MFRAMRNESLPIAMAAAVPLYIIRFQEKGGPDDEDIRQAHAMAGKLGEHGDILLFGGGKKGECAELFNETARAIAVMAFCPGGVTVFGNHFEAKSGAVAELDKASASKAEGV